MRPSFDLRERRRRARYIARALDRLIGEPPIPLEHRDPFTLLVAVVLSAHSTDRKVNEVTPALFARAPDAAALAAMPESELRALIRPVGLAPTKARHLRAMATLLLERHGGRVPNRLEALEALPGVGHKTASVVLAQAFGMAAFPVDTHIHRLATRWGLSTGRSVIQTERDLRDLFPPSRWGTLHLQMIHYGRRYCPARGHDVARCPICAWVSRRDPHRGQVEARPTRR
ncbi:MAG: endonuclease III [Myxococcota bacterium]|nr:endonuclease III [Myxococcota bacterium]MDW8363311.1 endonuclease III [Myxococcales bacterium]